MFTKENFINGLKAATNLDVEERGNELILIREPKESDEFIEKRVVIAKIPIREIESIEKELRTGYSFNETLLSTETSFEVAVQTYDILRMLLINDDKLYTLFEHNYSFEISKASNKYVFAIICCYLTKPTFNFNLYSFRTLIRNTIEELFESFHIHTVKITSKKKQTLSEFKRMLQSYLFNISYNYNAAYLIEDFSKDKHNFIKPLNRSGQLFPYKSYKQELTKYHLQALSVDIPFTQYLAFYHVAEFFFQSISEQDAFQEIESFITRPSFSPYKEDDIRRFYEIIKRKIRDQRDDGVWNEKVGLLLCLKKYVPDLESLKTSIINIDATAVDYYKNSLVEFTDDSKTINFNDNIDKIYSDIRDRVYSVRNSIVHSKEGDKLRYEPFKHDKELTKEIPLIRCIAEEIIINSSKPIEYNFDE